MKKHSYISLVTIMSMSLFTAPLLALNPFDDSNDVKIQQSDANKENNVARIEITIKDSESKSHKITITKDSLKKYNKTPSKGKISADSLNIRSYPWGDVMGTYSKGDEVEIIGELGDWYRIKYKGQIGYIQGNWVSTSDKEGQTAPKYGLVSSSFGINICRTPSGDVISRLNGGSQVNIIGEVGDWYKIELNGNEAFVSKKYIDLVDTDLSQNGSDTQNSNVVDQSFTGYVTASALNVRSGPWGNVDDVLYNGAQVKVIGKDGDWFLIEHNGETKYVYMDFISQSEPSGSSSSSSENNDSGNAVAANDGSLEQNIVQQAKALVGSTDFRTADVNYGSVACAKVVSTALNNAGAISEDEMSLDCYVLRDNLKAKGWAEVTPPPYQEGDVIFWSTYDWTGDGVIDEDTHVGIIVKEGNTYKAMNNSSSQKMPRIGEIDDFTISRVLRRN